MGNRWKHDNSKTYTLAGAGTQTAGLSNWWLYNSRSSKMQQKNIMVQLGQLEEI
jgi:hypothetical protein